MTRKLVKNAPKDVTASNEAITQPLAATQSQTLYNDPIPDGNQNVFNADNEHGLLLYEFRQGGKSKRFMQKEYCGKHYAELREWFRVGDEWKPSRKGCTIPIDEIAALCHALKGHNGVN